MEDFNNENFSYSNHVVDYYGANDQLFNSDPTQANDGSTSLLAELPSVPVSDNYINGGSQQFTAQEAALSYLDPFFPEGSMPWNFKMANIAEENEEYSYSNNGTPVDDNAPLEGRSPGCPEKTGFPTRSALKRHKDKHVPPFICAHPSCHHKSFRDKGGFDRHQREVHSSQTYTCPVSSCRRSKRGFNRQYNLLEHQKRKHKLRPARLLQVRSNTIESLSTGEDGQTLQYEDHVVDSDKDSTEAGTPDLEGGSTTAETSLRAKLRELKILRAQLNVDIDEDIVALQKALRVFGAASK